MFGEFAKLFDAKVLRRISVRQTNDISMMRRYSCLTSREKSHKPLNDSYSISIGIPLSYASYQRLTDRSPNDLKEAYSKIKQIHASFGKMLPLLQGNNVHMYAYQSH